jgi:NAD(P)H-hydrate repair Nnr-like enzyme with NAD(P)H-hydrate epimerase domain
MDPHGSYKFPLTVLMELAGQSVAYAIHHNYPPKDFPFPYFVIGNK